MKYYNSKLVKGTFDEVKVRVTDALKEQGFGVLTEIDLKSTLKTKLGKDYLPHTILGACHPGYADRALTADINISTMLPCNVTVKEVPGGQIEVATINPSAAMGNMGNDGLKQIGEEVQEKLVQVLSRL